MKRNWLQTSGSPKQALKATRSFPASSAVADADRTTPNKLNSSTGSDKAEIARLLPFQVKSQTDLKRRLNECDDDNEEKKKQFSSSCPASIHLSFYFELKKLKMVEKKEFSQQQYQDEFDRQFNLLGDTTERKISFLHFHIPGTNWHFVRPYQYESKKGAEIWLPQLLDDLYFFYNNSEHTCFSFERVPAELISSEFPAIDILVQKKNSQLLSLSPELVSLLFNCSMKTERLNIFDKLANSMTGYAQERELEHFYNTSKETRRSSNYLLLDPREFENNEKVTFVEFIRAIFYVGKASSSGRPHCHLSSTHSRMAAEIQNKFGTSFKKCRIRDIWDEGRGVIILSLFHHISDAEALQREHCLIVARQTRTNHRLFNGVVQKWEEKKSFDFTRAILGPLDLANKNHGNPPGKGKKAKFVGEKIAPENVWRPTFPWARAKKAEFGSRLLLRAFGIFKLERCLEIKEDDAKRIARDEEQDQTSHSQQQRSPATMMMDDFNKKKQQKDKQQWGGGGPSGSTKISNYFSPLTKAPEE